MASTPALPSEIQQALARGWTVLTANQRAARSLRRAFDLDQRAAVAGNWQPPAILAWDTWLGSLWRSLLLEGHATELLLSPTQEHTVWRAVIAADAATSSLRPIDALAETAASAWLLLHTYRGRTRLRDYAGNSDTRVFARWLNEFEHRCNRAQYLTQAQLPETLRTAIAAHRIAVPTGLLLLGFDSQTPARAALLEALRAAGCEVGEPEPSPPAARLTLAAAPTEQDELAACAHWLRARLIEQPTARIAVIVPAIETARAEIDRVFRQVLAPELNDIAAPAHAGPFEFSLGVPLAHTPMVAIALDLLRWSTGPLALERISALLLSPYFAASDTTEHLARAEFDAFVLRQSHLLQPRVQLGELEKLVAHPDRRTALPLLNSHLHALRPLFNRRELTTDERTHADWAATFHELLEAAGWAIPARLDSTEFQTRGKWESALDELATLDFDNARVKFADALAALERIATQTLFAPESRHAPVQIMGPLESAGSTFDAVWFLRANDSEWPANPAPNPLLSWPLQRDLGMPGATPSLDHDYACRITARIAASAPVAVFSYAKESTDGVQRHSATLSGLNIESRDASVIAPIEATAPPVELETFYDLDLIVAPPDVALRGGASILQNQAACAFRAFAEKRLFAASPETIELGLDARERGTLIHKTLELFWTEVQTQHALQQMPRLEREDLLMRSIDTALARQTSTAEPGWPRAYFATERRRLFRLLDEWLTLEEKRSPFAVKALEQTLPSVQIGRLHIDVRVDRIDTSLLDGEPAGDIILDYKTGSVTPAAWLGDRPDEPQLPLYSVVANMTGIAAIAFASVRSGEDQPLKGYESRKGVLLPKATPLKTDSLDAQIESWHGVLSNLANDFYAGDARVAPKQYPSTCRNCQQRLLCRLDLASLDPDANEDFVDAKDPAAETPQGSPAEVELG
jgi:ATP-dependent helicase/nuclease subunit B